VSPAKAKRLAKLLRLFEWRTTHRNNEEQVLTFCDGISCACLPRLLKELNNLTGRRITTEQIRAVVYAFAHALADDTGVIHRDDWDKPVIAAVAWCIGQYGAPYGR